MLRLCSTGGGAQRPGGRPGYSASSTSRVVAIERDGEVWHARVEAGGTAYDVDVHRELGEPTHLTCSTEQLKRPTHYVAGTPRVRAA